jgi:hypothetical protein
MEPGSAASRECPGQVSAASAVAYRSRWSTAYSARGGPHGPRALEDRPSQVRSAIHVDRAQRASHLCIGRMSCCIRFTALW